MLKFAHGNREHTGSKLEVDVIPAKSSGRSEGFSLFSIYRQSAAGSCSQEGDVSFEDTPSAEIALSMNNVAHILLVLDGKERDVLNGKGVRVRRRYDRAAGVVEDTRSKTYAIYCDKVECPFEGFAFHIVQLWHGTKSEGRIVLNKAEGAALRDALRASAGTMSFALVKTT